MRQLLVVWNVGFSRKKSIEKPCIFIFNTLLFLFVFVLGHPSQLFLVSPVLLARSNIFLFSFGGWPTWSIEHAWWFLGWLWLAVATDISLFGSSFTPHFASHGSFDRPKQSQILPFNFIKSFLLLEFWFDFADFLDVITLGQFVNSFDLGHVTPVDDVVV